MADEERGPSVRAVVLATDRSGRVLMVRQPGGAFAGAWLLPGGTVRAHERIEAGARREVREETGLELAELRLFALYEVMSVPAGRYHIVLHLFRAETLLAEPAPPRDATVAWRPPAGMRLHPAMRRQLRDARVIDDADADIDAALAAAGISMERLL
ncbi:MAG: NUDIX hydrolase [Candidatus Limnocylindria bacterium]